MIGRLGATASARLRDRFRALQPSAEAEDKAEDTRPQDQILNVSFGARRGQDLADRTGRNRIDGGAARDDEGARGLGADHIPEVDVPVAAGGGEQVPAQPERDIDDTRLPGGRRSRRGRQPCATDR
jgi:hypothetical protein